MNKKVILITAVSVLILAGGASGARVGYMYNASKNYSYIVYPDVAVEDIDLSGKTKDEAQSILKQKYGDIMLKKKIVIKANDKSYSIDYSKLDAKYNIDEVVDEAYAYGKDFNLMKKYNLIKNPVPTQFRLKFTYNSEPIKELIADIQKDNDKAPVNAAISMVSSGKFTITPDVKGAKLNVEKLEKEILDKINGDLTGDVEILAPVDVVQASVTGDVLSKVNTKVSSFSTNFSGSSANRVTNISLATKTINGKLLMPGDTFSFNDVVGKRTAERGYKEAPVIVGNKLDSGLGGGICQVSTTLYNAVIRANINSTERSHHTLPSHYIGLGMDATVDYGNLDYKFKNTLDYPIFLEGYIQGNIIGFNVYSDSSLTKRSYDLINEVYETMQPTTKYVDDANMYEGQTETVQPSSIGYKVRVYKKIYEGGKLVGQELISNETYNKVDATVKRGTKKKEQ